MGDAHSGQLVFKGVKSYYYTSLYGQITTISPHCAFCLQKVTDNIKELLESEDGIADIMNEHRSFNHHMHPTMQIFKPTTQIYTKLLSKHSMTNMEAVEKIIKEEASFFGDRGTK